MSESGQDSSNKNFMERFKGVFARAVDQHTEDPNDVTFPGEELTKQVPREQKKHFYGDHLISEDTKPFEGILSEETKPLDQQEGVLKVKHSNQYGVEVEIRSKK